MITLSEFDNWFDDHEDGEFTLPHVGDREIIGVGDAYDDLRINVLIQAYVDLRKAYHHLDEATRD